MCLGAVLLRGTEELTTDLRYFFFFPSGASSVIDGPLELLAYLLGCLDLTLVGHLYTPNPRPRGSVVSLWCESHTCQVETTLSPPVKVRLAPQPRKYHA